MILDATGERLGKIEVLGGILGAIIGIALFNIELFIIILWNCFAIRITIISL